MENQFKQIEELYQSVHEATKPIHNDPPGRKTWFLPKLRRLHHVHPSGSKMVRNPFAIIARNLYKVYEVIRNVLERFHAYLFPKREDRIYGVRDDGSVIGRITFCEREDSGRPIHHLAVELWGRTWIGHWRLLGQTSTNSNGEFSIPYDIFAVTGMWLRSNLRLEISHSEGASFEENGKVATIFEVYETRLIPKSALVGLRYNVGWIQLHYWEYRTDTPLPRVLIKDADDNPPQKYEQGRMDAISEQFIPVELISGRLKRKLARHPDRLSIDDIQKFYPTNMTLGMDDETTHGKRNKGERITRSDAYFGFRMMNGVYANIFDKWPDDPNTYWVHYHWSSYDHTDETFIFPDVTCKFKLGTSKYLEPTEIILRGALKRGEPAGTRRSLTPADGPHWQAAKRIARVQSALAAQVDKHFVGTHLNVEQYAIPIHRNIQRNPIGTIFYPHLRGITLINHTADKILVSPDGYVPRTSALTGKGLIDRCVDTLGTHDWKNFKPLDPISEKHTYAIVSNLFWDILSQFVEEFIQNHKEEIIDEWHEIAEFSEDLVKHSVPVFLCNYLGGHQKSEGANLGDWFTNSGRMDLSTERETIDGKVKAISPITKSSVFDPDSDDLANLKQVSVYIIYQATLGHFWSNFKQYDDIGELKYSTLGLRYGTGPDGALGPESDESIAPSKELCVETMWWANMLSRTGYGFIMTNEDNDIHPRLIELLKEHESEFDKYQFDIYDLQSRTNI